MFDYWRRVASRARIEALRDIRQTVGYPMIVFVVGCFAAWAVYHIRSEGAGLDAIVQILAAFGFVAFLGFVWFLIKMIAIPPRLYAAERQAIADRDARLARLQGATVPKLAFEIEPLELRYTYQRSGSTDCFITVRNASTAKTVDDVTVFMEWHSTGKRSRTQPDDKRLALQFQPGSLVNIPPTGLKHFRLCTILDEPITPPPPHEYPGRIVFAPDGDIAHAPKYAHGTYEVHVRVEGRDVPPVRNVYVLQTTATTTALTLDPAKVSANWPSET